MGGIRTRREGDYTSTIGRPLVVWEGRTWDQCDHDEDVTPDDIVQHLLGKSTAYTRRLIALLAAAGGPAACEAITAGLGDTVVWEPPK